MAGCACVDHAGDNFLGGKDIDGRWSTGRSAALARRGAGDRRRRRARAGAGRWRAAGRVRGGEDRAVARASARRSWCRAPGCGRRREASVELRDHPRRAGGLMRAVHRPQPGRRARACSPRNGWAPDDVGAGRARRRPDVDAGACARASALFGGRDRRGDRSDDVVARGAALYAGSVGLDATPAARAPAPAAGLAVRIEHPSVTADPGAVRGRPVPAPRAGPGLPARLTASSNARTAGGTSADAALSAEGSFVVQVRLERAPAEPVPPAGLRPRRRRRRWRAARSRSCTACRSADPPLSRALGDRPRRRYDQVYFARGRRCPRAAPSSHHTVRPVRRRQRRRRAGRSPSSGRVACGRTATG